MPSDCKRKAGMGILIVGGTPAHRGGVEQFCDRARKALSEIGGHRVEHVCSHGSYLRLRTLPSFLGSVLTLLTTPREKSEWVWLQYVSLPDLVLLLVCRLRRFTVLVTPHLGSNWASQTNGVMRWLSKAALATSNGIGLLSASQAKELALPVSPTRFELSTFLPRALPRRPASRPRNGPLRLVHAGRLSVGKGSFLFLDVCAILRRAGFTFEAALIGPFDDATGDRVHLEAVRAGLQGCLELLGPLPEAELLERLATADILVHLSQIDSFPLIVLESIGCGVFPICKDLPGARLMTQSYCGHIVGSSDVAAQAAQFILDADMDQLRTSADTASIRLKNDFDWSHCVAAVERAAARLLSRDGSAARSPTPRLEL